MRFVWVGAHAEGIPALEALLVAGAPIRAVLTLRPELASRRGVRMGDYRPVCERAGVPLLFIGNINEPRAYHLLCRLRPDVAFVIGWPQVVRQEVLRVARVGMVGVHGSLLPHLRGAAPVAWALVRGETATGATLLWLADPPEQAEIVDQTPFPVTPYDTSATLYARIAVATRDMLLRLLPRLLAGERPARPVPPSDEPPLRRRRAADGRIPWRSPSETIYNLIRGSTRPHPGAFGMLDGRRWRVWAAALPTADERPEPPGTVIGPVVSPVADACGLLVACGTGAIVLLELEADDGTILRGPTLSDLPWRGKQWRDG